MAEINLASKGLRPQRNCSYVIGTLSNTVYDPTRSLDGLENYMQSTEGGFNCLRSISLKQLRLQFGDVFEDQELCIAMMVDPRFKDNLFVTDIQRNKVVE